MKNRLITQVTGLHVNQSTQGESIERQVERAMNNKEPQDVSAGEPIYTERKDGVVAAYNIRTDRFEVAVNAMDAASGSNTLKRMNALKAREEGVIDLNPEENNGKPESTDGTK